jgi:hypothetical protein
MTGKWCRGPKGWIMQNTKVNGTHVYARLRRRGLTLAQQSAIDLLATGKTDTETAELLNLSRTCVSKWRCYDPAFQAALNARRAEVWSCGIDRLRSLIPKALDALAAELENQNSPNRLKAACELLRLAQIPDGALKAGPTEPEEIVRRLVVQQRQQAHGEIDDVFERGKDLPPFEEHLEKTWRELEARATATDESRS